VTTEGPQATTQRNSKVVVGRYKIVIAELKKEMSASEKQMDEPVFLDPDQKSPRAKDFEDRLGGRIVGQERAVRRMSGLYQIFLAGMNPPARPIGSSRQTLVRAKESIRSSRRQWIVLAVSTF